MNIIADLHTHTSVSAHAFSTMKEMIDAAAEKGLLGIGITNHGPSLPDGAHLSYFGALKNLKRSIKGVSVIRGVEANIIDYNGALDLDDQRLSQMDLVIASMHAPCLAHTDEDKITAAWLAVAENPRVDIIGHCGSDAYKFDYETAIQAFSKNNKVVEINSHSFRGRAGSDVNCREIARLCKKYGVMTAANSDAHIWYDVGRIGPSVALLEECKMPPELVLNAAFEPMAQWFYERKGVDITKNVE